MYRRSGHGLEKHLDFIIIDLVLLMLAFVSAYAFRFGSVTKLFASDAYIMRFKIMILAHVVAALSADAYKSILRRGYAVELWKTFLHVSLVLAIMLVFFFAMKNTEALSRVFTFVFYGLAIVFVYVGRITRKFYLRKNAGRRKRRKLLLVADIATAEQTLEHFDEREILDFELVGVVLTDTVLPDGGEHFYHGLPVVADSLEDAEAYIEHTVLDGVIFAVRHVSPVQRLIEKCEVMGLTVHIALRQLESLLGDETVERLGGVTVVSSCVKLVTGGELFLKRLLDIVGSAVGLVITGVALLFVAPAIYIADPGPIFFKQKRIGQGGAVFDCYKFRSMYTDAEERKKELMAKNEMTGYMFKMENDPRIIGSGEDGTRRGVGWFIRTFSIDELPQFWNVMRGDMSLVGTRPPTVDEWEHYAPHHRVRMRIRPGITGLWQVSGRSEITDFEEVVRLDREYIRTWSIALDIKIILKTVVVVIRRKGSR